MQNYSRSRQSERKRLTNQHLAPTMTLNSKKANVMPFTHNK